MGDYSSGDEATLPSDTTNLEHVYDAADRTAVGTDDASYVEQTATSEYPIHQYKDTITSSLANITWIGKSDQAPSTYPVYLQIYKTAAPAAWETIATKNTGDAGVDFTLQKLAQDTSTDYKDGSNVVCVRVYQDYTGGETVVNIGANTGNTGDIQDNNFDSVDTIENHGGQNVGVVGSTDGSRVRHTIMRPILSSIASDKTCVAASLFLYVTSDSGVNCTVNLYKITAENADWVEGNGVDAPVENTSCWNFKKYNSGGSDNWHGSAGCSTSGEDYEATSLGSAMHTAGQTGYFEIPLNASGLAVIQDWFGDATNNGLLLLGTVATNTWTIFASSEGTDGQRPYLEVTYS